METVNRYKKTKSEPLTRQELKALKEYRKGFETEVACAMSIGIDRGVLGRVILAGSGSPDSIAKIRATLNNVRLKQVG